MMSAEHGEHSNSLFYIKIFAEGDRLPAPATDKDVPPPTPMYDSIITNLPHPIMCYPSFWFPPSTPLFPKAEVVEDYLRAYAKEFDLMPHIQLSNAVTSAQWTGSHWSVLTSKGGPERTYDRLVVANGHYRVPHFPAISGLDSWRAAGRVTHSAWYRAPVACGDKVLVIGGGFSGIDIAEEMSTVSERVVHAAPHSVAESHGNVEVRDARVVRLSKLGEGGNGAGERTAYFEDGSSESGIDHIFLATGYVLSFPFLPPTLLLPTFPSYPASPSSPLPSQLHNDGTHLFPLSKHLFPLTSSAPSLPPTSLAFIGLPIKVAPFPLFEAQARALSHTFSDPSALSLPDETAAIHARLAALRSDPEVGSSPSRIAGAWHRFKGREQFEYRDALHAFAGLDAPEWRAPEWCVEAYENMLELRKAWKGAVESGEAEELVKGVGEGGNQEWVELIERMLEKTGTQPEDESEFAV